MVEQNIDECTLTLHWVVVGVESCTEAKELELCLFHFTVGDVVAPFNNK